MFINTAGMQGCWTPGPNLDWLRIRGRALDSITGQSKKINLGTESGYGRIRQERGAGSSTDKRAERGNRC